jgi:hypothetical protein
MQVKKSIFQVKPKTPIIDVPEIKGHSVPHLLHLCRLSPEAVHLRPPRYPWFDMMTECIVRYEVRVLIIMGDGMWARTDERHITLQHVKELRELINAGRPQHTSYPCDAIIITLDLIQ